MHKKYLRSIIFISFLVININDLYSQNGNSIDSLAQDSSHVTYKILPFAFYHNSLGFILGGFGGIKGFAQEQTFAKLGGIISTNGSYYGYLQIEDFQIPFFPRLSFRPDIYIGKLGEVKAYLGAPNAHGIEPGSNDSGESDYLLVKGNDTWLEFNFKYLLPFGDGKETVILHPKFQDGILISGEAGGKTSNPFTSGRTFLSTKIIYRKMDLENDLLHLTMTTFATDFSLIYENVDYYFNPTIGSIKKLSYIRDWGVGGSNSKSDVIKLDLRWYFPLFDRKNIDEQRVLAFNFYTADIPSWNEYDIIGGKKSYHRPQHFAGANLGGVRFLRSYKDFRFYDKSLILYSLELRQKLSWNPFNYWSVTKKIGVDFIQAVLFADVGRVAPNWNFDILHTNMKYSVGGGIRLFINGLVARIDIAYGKDGILTQMYIDHPF